MKGPIIRGEQYVPVVLRITERDGFGRPQKADIMLEGDKADLTDGKPREFIVAFAREDLVARQTKGSA